MDAKKPWQSRSMWAWAIAAVLWLAARSGLSLEVSPDEQAQLIDLLIASADDVAAVAAFALGIVGRVGATKRISLT